MIRVITRITSAWRQFKRVVLVEIVDHYGEILFAYLNINCFKTNPSIDSSVKFLKKPIGHGKRWKPSICTNSKACPEPRRRNLPCHLETGLCQRIQKPGEPAALSLEDAERLREKRAEKAAARSQGSGYRSGAGRSAGAGTGKIQPQRPQ